MNKPNISKLRRFSLVVGVVLFLYAIAGVQLKTPLEISPLGIPMTIKNPNLMGYGLVIASFYMILRYSFYAIFIGPSPSKIRQRLKWGVFPDGSEPIYDSSTGNLRIQNDLNVHLENFFPSFRKWRAGISHLQHDINGVEFRIVIPWQVTALCWAENIDYCSPIWVNGIAVYAYYLSIVLK